MMLLKLQGGVLYGPVKSRRLGKSLGINLMPSRYKLCSFNCIYCHYGWTRHHTMDPAACLEDLPALDDVVQALERAAKSSMEFDFITLSGNGEPTLYPQFPSLVDEAVRIRDRHRPEAKIVLLSNSTGTIKAAVRACVPKIDVPVFKLDVGTEEKFKAINRPARGVNYEALIETLSCMERIYIQTVMIGGIPSNVAERDLVAYFQRIHRIRPKEVHLYSIDRPVPHTRIALVPPERLAEIALQGERHTGVRIRTFSLH